MQENEVTGDDMAGAEAIADIDHDNSHGAYVYEVAKVLARHRQQAEDAMREQIACDAAAEAGMYRHAQDVAGIGDPDKLYRMGQKDAMLLFSDAIRATPPKPDRLNGEGGVMDRQEPYMPIAMVTDDTPVEIAPGVIVTLKEAIARRQPMTAPDPLREDEVEALVAKLSKAQRDAVLACRKRATGAGGERWDFSVLSAGTRKALVRQGVAQPWGVVSASLSELGIAARAAILQLDQVREGRGK